MRQRGCPGRFVVTLRGYGVAGGGGSRLRAWRWRSRAAGGWGGRRKARSGGAARETGEALGGAVVSLCGVGMR